MRAWWIGVVMLLVAARVEAATYFAVGTGNWSATSTWSLTSGGTTGVGPPGVGDIAKLDGNTGTVTLNVDVTLQSVLSDTGATLAGTTLDLTTHTLTIDTGTLNNGTPTFADEFTIVPGTSTVVCNGGSIAPHGQPLYDITITGSCNFGRTETAHNVTISAGATLNLEAIGSPARFYVFNSLLGTAGTALGTWNPGGLAPKLITTQQVNLTGFTVTGIDCEGTVPCLADATSTDGGGNTNWCFGAGCSNATYTPTPTPTVTPTVTPTATPNVTPGCGAISTNPSGLTCLDAAMETAAGLDCSLIVPGGSPQGTEACCIDIAAFNSYCTGDTGTTCTGDGDCVGTGPCVIVTCAFMSGGACSPATFPDGAIGGACVAAATATPTVTPTVTPTTTPTSVPCGTPPYVITTTTDSTAAGSLRWAVGCCNGDTLNVPAGTYTLALGELPIQRPCTINGAGMSATLVDANNASRVFNIGNFSGDVTVRDLTVENGNVGGLDCGGGIELGTCHGFLTTSANLLVQRVRFNGNSASVGGGIDDNSSGTLTVSDTVCDHNTATLLPNGDGACVFGEYNNGAITLSGMTITDNSGATSSVSVFAPNTGSATLALTNTTFGGNTTPYDIDIGGNSTATVVNVSAAAIRGSASLPTHSVTQVANSIVRSCTLDGGAASITSLGHNIDTGTSCGFTATGDLQNTDPLLNALASNGGPTQTMSLQGGSPAINGGDDAICAAGPVSGLDQRGYVRPGAGQAHCSIGAYENAGMPGGITPGRKHGFSGGAVINVQ